MMKKNNETWLSFFKKTLKVTGITILVLVLGTISIIGFMIYNYEENNQWTTYLNCEDRYIAFDKYNMYSQWDGLEKNWKISLDVTKKNKSVVEAEFTYGSNTPQGETTGIYIIDRINGTIELKNLSDNKSLALRKCKKIKKSQLPKSKVNPKF